jgi:hypothetical protein
VSAATLPDRKETVRKKKRKKIRERDVLDGQPRGQVLARDPENPGWIANGHWVVSTETHDADALLADPSITREAPIGLAVEGLGARVALYAVTWILVERDDGALLRVFRGPEKSWLAICEYQRELALLGADAVWAPAPKKPGTFVQGFAGLETGSGVCAGVMTCSSVGAAAMGDVRARAGDVAGDGWAR